MRRSNASRAMASRTTGPLATQSAARVAPFVIRATSPKHSFSLMVFTIKRSPCNANPVCLSHDQCIPEEDDNQYYKSCCLHRESAHKSIYMQDKLQPGCLNAAICSWTSIVGNGNMPCSPLPGTAVLHRCVLQVDHCTIMPLVCCAGFLVSLTCLSCTPAALSQLLCSSHWTSKVASLMEHQRTRRRTHSCMPAAILAMLCANDARSPACTF